MIDSLDLAAAVRVLGFTPIEDFNGYIGACDIVLNLRYPDRGRKFGHAAARAGHGQGGGGVRRRIVPRIPGRRRAESAGGCDRRRPHFRVPEPAGVAARVRAKARARMRANGWRANAVGRWWRAATRSSWRAGADFSPRRRASSARCTDASDRRSSPAATGRTPKRSGPGRRPKRKEYVESHITRLARTLEITPPGTATDRILEMGAYLQITPALRTQLGYGEVRGCYYGPGRRVGSSHGRVRCDGEEFDCDIDLFDAEKDRLPL